MIALGPFDLFAEIGKGGAGQVWSAVHRVDRQPVAVKFLSPHRASHPTFRAVFHNEVRAVAALNHPAIVRVYDYGEVTARVAAASEGRIALGSPYLIMELVRGGTLDDVVGHLSWNDLRSVLASLLDALAHAHARGVIHRDIKPGNVLLAFKEEAADGPRVGVKLTDFGLAHAFDAAASASEMSAEGGTPAYMAPEQVHGRWYDFGPWTDLYSFGCLAYYLASGRPPFGTSRLQALRRAQSAPEIPRLEPILPVPDGFMDWIGRLLASAPDQRFQWAADALHGLLALVPPRDDAPVFPSHVSKEDLSTLTATAFLTELTSFVQDVAEPMDEPTETSAPIFPPPPSLPLPPFPEDWRRPDPPRPTLLLEGAGLGLYGLRTVPFVGREVERSTLWKLLSEVRSTRRARVAVIRGPAGVGKSRLAEWISRRASEVGAATILRVAHAPVGGPAIGLGGALQTMFRTFGMSREEVGARVEQRLRRLGIDDADEVSCITEWIAPAPEGTDSQVRFSSASERYLVIDRLLARLASRRPVILFCDDTQWGLDTLLFIRHRLEDRQSKVPVLAVLVATDTLFEGRPLERSIFAELEAHPQVGRAPLGALDDEDGKTLVSHLLPLEKDLQKHVLDLTRGNPQFAVQLVGDWVEQRALEPGDRGFRLREGRGTAMPTDLFGLWSGRVSRVLAQLSETEGLTLQVAATLGLVVDGEEWRRACEAAGLVVSDRVQSVVLRQNLARSLDPLLDVGFVFGHELVRQVLVDAFPNRKTEAHRACALGLEQRRGSDPARIGHHWWMAGEADRALGPYLEAARQLARNGQVEMADAVLDRREDALRSVDPGSIDPRWFGQWLERARSHLTQPELSSAEHQAATGALDRAQAVLSRDPTGIVQLALERGRLALVTGQPSEARRIAAEILAAQTSLGVDEGRALHILGSATNQLGDRDEAVRSLDAAARRLEDYGVLEDCARAWLELGEITREAGRLDEAGRLLARSLQRFEQAGRRGGMAAARSALGALGLAEGRHEDAVEHFSLARDLFLAIGSSDVSRVRMQLALVHLSANRIQGALSELMALRGHVEAFGPESTLSDVHLALAACWGELGEWEAWDHELEHAERLFDPRSRSRISGELAARLAERAQLARQPERVERATALSRRVKTSV